MYIPVLGLHTITPYHTVRFVVPRNIVELLLIVFTLYYPVLTIIKYYPTVDEGGPVSHWKTHSAGLQTTLLQLL